MHLLKGQLEKSARNETLSEALSGILREIISGMLNETLSGALCECHSLVVH